MSVAEKVYAYLMIDVLVDVPDQLELPDGYQQQVTSGEIVLRYDYPGNGTHAFTFEDGPVKLRATGVYLCTGVIDGSGSPVFDYGATRILNLVKIGQEAEKTLTEQVHMFADKIREMSEDKLKGPLGRDGLDAWIGSIDYAEKTFMRS